MPRNERCSAAGFMRIKIIYGWFIGRKFYICAFFNRRRGRGGDVQAMCVFKIISDTTKYFVELFMLFIFFSHFGLMAAFCISPLSAVSVEYNVKESFPKCDCGLKTV